MDRIRSSHWRTLHWTALLTLGTLVACAPVPVKTPEPPPGPSVGASPSAPSESQQSIDTKTQTTPKPMESLARNAKDYRQDAARHLYRLHADQIYTGKLPPMLYAIGVLEIHLDAKGHVSGLHWLRAPKHAPEVIERIESLARQSAPYPKPTRLGRVVYTETWLWDRSGRFQLDTLSEGQL